MGKWLLTGTEHSSKMSKREEIKEFIRIKSFLSHRGLTGRQFLLFQSPHRFPQLYAEEDHQAEVEDSSQGPKHFNDYFLYTQLRVLLVNVFYLRAELGVGKLNQFNEFHPKELRPSQINLFFSVYLKFTLHFQRNFVHMAEGRKTF